MHARVLAGLFCAATRPVGEVGVLKPHKPLPLHRPAYTLPPPRPPNRVDGDLSFPQSTPAHHSPQFILYVFVVYVEVSRPSNPTPN